MEIEITRVDELLFKMEWNQEVEEPTEYLIYREGQLIDSITSNGSGAIYLTIGIGESPFVEVIPSGEKRRSLAYPGRVKLNWLTVTGAEKYRIQKFVSSTWENVGEAPEDGLGAFNFATDWLSDSTVHKFRMVPIDAAGNLGTPFEHEFLMVRHPDVPNVSYSYDSETGKITVTQA